MINSFLEKTETTSTSSTPSPTRRLINTAHLLAAADRAVDVAQRACIEHPRDGEVAALLEAARTERDLLVGKLLAVASLALRRR